MRNHFSHISIAVLTAAVAVACSNQQNDRRVQSGGNRGTNERVSLQGCVIAGPGAGAGSDAYELRGVNEAEPEREPQGQDRMEHAPLIERGSWVRLASGSDDLKKYVGKHVSVSGEIRDRGTNTVGTSGQASQMPRAGEANGAPPLIAVERITESQGTCPSEGK